MPRICVFCGSQPGRTSLYRAAAIELAHELARRGIGLVFGGGSVGLMGVLADAMLGAGAEVIGVIPRKLARKELLHHDVPTMYVVESMHARKARMAELADAFIAMPGGLGTFEELFEVVTWAQLGFHNKSIGLLNVAGYFDPLVTLTDHAIDEGFVKPEHRDLIVVERGPRALLDRLAIHQHSPDKRRISVDET